ncbi:MAG: type IV pilus twitching motility protein PilT [Gammaproteobacteria bacterium]|nr:type IV pilus twitching motility protein PilT [Gammaproteobacteria bacterium]
MEIAELLAFTVKQSASDLHLSAAMSPMLRIDGDMVKVNLEPLSHEQLETMLVQIMDDAPLRQLRERGETDFSYSLSKLARFRVNVFNTQRGIAAVFRLIPNEIRTLEALGVPPAIKSVLQQPNGLVLVTGPTGSGKSTTLAAMVEHINTSRPQHILTIEDPIEYIHTSSKSLINQRQLGRDTNSYASALRAALREDPDVILVGEMRDLDTIRLALSAAETGHLVLATLHTNSAAKTINRIIDVFPGEERALIRSLLSESLRAILSQTLLKADGGGRIAAYEVLINTPAVRNMIREDKLAQIVSVMQTGAEQGMHTLDQHLAQLQSQGKIDTKGDERTL